MKPIVYFATDHAGFELKEEIFSFVKSLGYSVIDCGAFELDALDDYPDFISKAALAVSEKPDDARAIIFGGSGQGEAMVANRFSNVRATVYYGGPSEIISLSREHNNANVLSIGARFVDTEDTKSAVAIWLEQPFSGDERHVRRINKIDTTLGNQSSTNGDA